MISDMFAFFDRIISSVARFQLQVDLTRYAKATLPKKEWTPALLCVCPEMIFRLRKPFGNKDANSDCLTGRKTSLFSNFFGNLDNNSLWL